MHQLYTNTDNQLFNFHFMAKKNTITSTCPVDYAFQRIGGKYKARILWQLENGLKRYGQLRKLLLDVTPKMLTQALRELEEDMLIVRKVYLEVPPRVEYSLTPTGIELLPSIKLLGEWGKKKILLRNVAPHLSHLPQQL